MSKEQSLIEVAQWMLATGVMQDLTDALGTRIAECLKDAVVESAKEWKSAIEKIRSNWTSKKSLRIQEAGEKVFDALAALKSAEEAGR